MRLTVAAIMALIFVSGTGIGAAFGLEAISNTVFDNSFVPSYQTFDRELYDEAMRDRAFVITDCLPYTLPVLHEPPFPPLN